MSNTPTTPQLRVKFGVSRETIEERSEMRKTIPEGYYKVQLKGFDPKWSKEKTSKNMNPRMVLVETGNLGLDGKKRVFENLNENADWIQLDFCHCFGVEREADPDTGVLGVPGYFVGKNGVAPDPMNPETWQYVDTAGILDKVGVVKLIVQNPGAANERNSIDQYVCAFGQNCPLGPNEKHTAHLVTK